MKNSDEKVNVGHSTMHKSSIGGGGGGGGEGLLTYVNNNRNESYNVMF